MVISRSSYFLEREELAFGESVVRYVHPELGPGWLYFGEHCKVIVSATVEGVRAQLGLVESEVQRGAYAVGWLSYEAGFGFNDSLPAPAEGKVPFLWFVTYKKAPEFFRELLPVYDGASRKIQLEWDLHDYADRFAKVKHALAVGESYQVNLTLRANIHTDVSMFKLFRSVCGTQPAPYATYINGGYREIASFSPELFLERKGSRVTMSPMKGTRKLGDAELPEMRTDPKSRAENLMIVDMVRNDLGRIARIGSVETTKLFELESHRTVRQMTSRVEAETGAGFVELMNAVFPPASITGAPKIAACRLIRELESSPREIYCGAIGLLEPGGDMRFSVAIRTAWKNEYELARESNSEPVWEREVKYGVGSGVVWDSKLEDEFEECLLKADVVTHPAPQWELVECFHRDAVLDPALLEDHWQRVSASAAALGVPLTRKAFEALILPLRAREDLPNKVRVAIRRDGKMSLSVSESAVTGLALRATIATSPISSQDANLAHKTNSRQVFEDALANSPGHDEVLLFNERGEVAEFCRGNAVFRFGERWITPSPGSGCLPGVGAKRIVAQGKASYGVVSLDEARRADEVWFVNSIRGLIPVELEWKSGQMRGRPDDSS